MTPKQAAKLRILDPACGSGSFLIGAYEYLLKWHRDWYENHDPEKHARGRKPKLYRGRAGDWRLTTAERKRILLNNIYGVDIDPQAVEVTKLSLLLKVLEGESQETLSNQLRLFHERALPDLSANIKCGNSLIGPDFYADKQMSLLDEEKMYRINAFDWKAEFPEMFKGKNGGFDAVIGNPPYVRQESLRQYKAYFKPRYASYESTADLYVYFIERAASLLRQGGFMSFIVSSSFLRTNFGRPLRRFLRDRVAVHEVVDFGGLPVFSGAKDTYVCIPLIAKQEQPSAVRVAKVSSLRGLDLPAHVSSASYLVPVRRFAEDAWCVDDERVSAVFDRLLERTTPLGDCVAGRIFRGLITGLNKAFEIDARTRERFVRDCAQCKALIHPFLGGQDVRRYRIRPHERYLVAIPCGWTRRVMGADSAAGRSVLEREAWEWFSHRAPALAEHLAPFAEAGRKRQDKGDFWWELRPCDYYSVLDGPKIIYPDIAKGPRFYVDREGMYIRNTAYCLAATDPYLLGILNSQLAWFAIARISIPFGSRAGDFRYRLFTQYVRQIPIRAIDWSNKDDRSRHKRMVDLVERMLSLQKEVLAAKTAHQKTVLHRQIEATDREIDRLVYELYGLTEEEIGIVEESTR